MMTGELPSQARKSNPPILAAVDGSAVSYHAVAWAAADAALHGCGLRLITSAAFQAAYGPAPMVTSEQVDRLRTDAEEILAEAERIAHDVARAVPVGAEVIFDPIIPSLITRSWHARSLVVGSRGRGALRRGLLGSVSSAVVHHARCPVVVVHTMSATDAVSMGKPVLVGVDGSPNSVPAIEIAFEEAALRGVGLVALHAWSDTSGADLVTSGWATVRQHEDMLLAQSLAGYAERYPDVPVRRVLVREQPARSLLAESENAQLAVVGSHGRGGFTGMLLGSTSAALVQSAECPVVVVRDQAVKEAGAHRD
jgi:nucleotide-binding universal stress UspA family protein